MLDGISMNVYDQGPNYCNVVFAEQQFCIYLLPSWFCKLQPSPLQTKELLSFHPVLEKMAVPTPA